MVFMGRRYQFSAEFRPRSGAADDQRAGGAHIQGIGRLRYARGSETLRRLTRTGLSRERQRSIQAGFFSILLDYVVLKLRPITGSS